MRLYCCVVDISGVFSGVWRGGIAGGRLKDDALECRGYSGEAEDECELSLGGLALWRLVSSQRRKFSVCWAPLWGGLLV